MNNSTTTHQSLTCESSFFPCNPQREDLFQVRDGVPAIDALQMASSMLEASIAGVFSMAEEVEGCEGYASAYSLQFVKGLVDSVLGGLCKDRFAKIGGMN